MGVVVISCSVTGSFDVSRYPSVHVGVENERNGALEIGSVCDVQGNGFRVHDGVLVPMAGDRN